MPAMETHPGRQSVDSPCLGQLALFWLVFCSQLGFQAQRKQGLSGPTRATLKPNGHNFGSKGALSIYSTEQFRLFDGHMYLFDGQMRPCALGCPLPSPSQDRLERCRGSADASISRLLPYYTISCTPAAFWANLGWSGGHLGSLWDHLSAYLG